jgi:hypothetical protein
MEGFSDLYTSKLLVKKENNKALISKEIPFLFDFQYFILNFT